MKSLKSLLAVIVAICLMMSLAIPAFATSEGTTEATETTGAATDTTVATEDDTADASDAATEDTAAAVEEGAEEEHDHNHEAESEEAEEPESGFIKVLRVIVTVLEVIASIALIGVVLLQSGKEAGLSGALAGNSDSYMNKNGMGGLDKTLAKATKWVALAWLVLTLLLCLL